MPKRTNDFQTLIKTIYEQITPEGGKVTESGMLHDKEAGILREVDILVEYRYAGHEFCFIVECRDRSRAETVEWIDNLIGKAKSLSVNKVVAVSKNGFASSANNKAKENGIETLTLEKALETDWVKFPIKPGLTLVTDDVYRIESVFYEFNNKYIPITHLGLDSKVELNGEILGDLRGLIEYFFKENLAPKLDKYKKEHTLEIFKTKEDLEKTLRAEKEYNWSGITIITNLGERIELSKIKYIVVGTRKSMDVEQEHYIFNKKMVSTGKYLEAQDSTIDFNIVQDPETEKIHIKWKRSKKQ